MIEHGHRWIDIKAYSLSELGVFIREVMRQERDQNKIDILNNWLGTNADKKYIDKLIKEHQTVNNFASKDNTGKSLSHQEAHKEWKRLASTLGKLGLG